MKAKIRAKMISGPDPSGAAPKFWNIASVSEEEGEIVLYGDVMSKTPVDWWTGEPEPGMYITPEGFMDDLAAVKDKSRITVKLNSCGGDLYTGIAIHNAIKALNAYITVVVEGIAASAASVIMCAGDNVQVYPGSLIMIHEPSIMIYDYCGIDDLKKLIKGLEAGIDASAEIYAQKTGDDVDHLKTMIHRETWMTGQKAIDNGFANELLTGSDFEAKMVGKEVLMIAGVKHDIRGMHVPDDLGIKRISAAPAAEIIKSGDTGENTKGGTPKMFNTPEELRAAQPDLVSQIERAAASEAVARERERIREIDEISAAVGDAELISEAKYGETACNAADLALRSMQKQAKLGVKHLENAEKDFAESGASEVKSASSEDTDNTKPTKEQRMAQGRADAKATLAKEVN